MQRSSRRVTRLQARRSRRILENVQNVEEEEEDTARIAQAENDDSNSIEVNADVVEGRNAPREVVHLINATDSEDDGDVEFVMATDSDDSSNGNRRNVSSASQSRTVNVSPGPSSGGSQSGAPPLILSSVAQRMSCERSPRAPRPVRDQEIVEIDLDNPEVNRENHSGHEDDVVVVGHNIEMEVVEMLSGPESDDDVELVFEEDIGIVAEFDIRDRDMQFPILRAASPIAEEVNNGNDNQEAAPIPADVSRLSPDILNAATAGGSGSSGNANRTNEDSGNGDESDDHEEDEGPPQKMPRLETSVRSDDDNNGCHICFEPYENSGGHRPCCLKCGHIFGKDCIERWIKAQKRCPDCNSKAMVKDVRVIYVKNLKAIDTAELDRMKGEVDKLKIEKNRVELTNAQLRCQIQIKTQELERLRVENIALRSLPLKDSTEKFNVQAPEPCTSAKAMEPVASCSSQVTGLRMPKLQLIKNFHIKEGQSRVGAYNEWMNLLVVSHGITSALFPSGSYGIKKINSLEMKAFQSFPIHQRPIRDMAFSPLQNDLLLSVSLDKKAVLFNCNSNCPVQTFSTPSSLWSCCWNTVNQNIFYVGSVTGQVTSYDIRAPQEPVSTLFIPTGEKSGVARLKFVPPSYQSQSFNMSGLLIQKLNSVWFSEMLGGSEADPRYHQLPLEGPFLNVDFEPSSRHVLVSARPRQIGNQRFATSHTVCDLGKTYSETEGRDLFSCDIVQVMNGGFQESTIMCRSALFSPQKGQVYVAANGEGAKTVRVWDVANIEQKALIRVNQAAALDFVHGSINETNFLGVITENALDVYDIK